jgi:hypothetical protein
VTGLCRFKIEEILQDSPFPIAMVSQLDKLPGEEIGKGVPSRLDQLMIFNSWAGSDNIAWSRSTFTNRNSKYIFTAFHFCEVLKATEKIHMFCTLEKKKELGSIDWR